MKSRNFLVSLLSFSITLSILGLGTIANAEELADNSIQERIEDNILVEEVCDEENNIEQRYNLIIPSYMIVYDDEELSRSVIRQIEELNGVKIVSSSIMSSQFGNIATVRVIVTDNNGNTGSGTISVTIRKRPVKPVIYANDRLVILGDELNVYEGVTAKDEEDGDITWKVKVISNNVDVNKAGGYKVTYEVTDSDNLTVQKTINIIVKENEAPKLTADDVKVILGGEFNPMSNVTAIDDEDGDITSKIVLVSNSVNVNKIGTYKVKYSVKDSRNVETLKERTVKVIVDPVSDWINSWAKNEILYAMENNWVKLSNNFRVNDAITRAEFIKIANKAFGFTKSVAIENFTDVESGNWFYDEVRIALKAGYITSNNSTFRPNDPITREEVANIITTIKKNKDGKLDKLELYKDKNLISHWAMTSVEGAIEAGYMGRNSDMFNPRKNITRAEAVTTLYRVVR